MRSAAKRAKAAERETVVNFSFDHIQLPYNLSVKRENCIEEAEKGEKMGSNEVAEASRRAEDSASGECARISSALLNGTHADQFRLSLQLHSCCSPFNIRSPSCCARHPRRLSDFMAIISMHKRNYSFSWLGFLHSRDTQTPTVWTHRAVVVLGRRPTKTSSSDESREAVALVNYRRHVGLSLIAHDSIPCSMFACASETAQKVLFLISRSARRV